MIERTSNDSAVSSPASQGKVTPLMSHDNTMAVYTVLKVLLKMKEQLGVEAMLDYVSEYTTILERANPKFQAAVRIALSYINVDKLYRDARNEIKQ